MTTSNSRHLSIEGTYNLRDLGGYATPDGETGWRRMLRADSLHRLQPEGVAELYDMGIRTIIDLRHDHELERAPNPFGDHPGVSYIHIPLFDQLAPSPPQQAADLPTNVLLGLYCRAITERQDAVRRVLTAMADADEGGVLCHCTAGKDRTGIIAALLLSIAGVTTPTILEDYALTKAAMASMIDRIVEDAVARGVDIVGFMPLLACETPTLQGMLDHIDGSHGGVAAYLAEIGIETETLDRLRARLMVTQMEASQG